MGIEYYSGFEGPCVNVESVQDLADVIDVLHTQCCDNLPEDSFATRLLESVMESLDARYGVLPKM